MSAGVLFVVATPIGNLDDITLRALDVLRTVDFIAAEDTRHSARLLGHYSIDTPMFAVHDHNEEASVGKVSALLEQGQSVALISDAGTPLINDPGYKLIRTLKQQGHAVQTVPGPCALIAALSVAGLPTDRFVFNGFLPTKTSARCAALEQHLNDSATQVYYESPKRIMSTVTDIAKVFGVDRTLVLAKELTKAFETVIKLPAGEMIEWLQADQHHTRGEFVVLIQGVPRDSHRQEISPTIKSALQLARAQMPLKPACELVSKLTGASKNELYRQALSEDQQQ